jgi:endo-1,4-beta-xylanase
LLINDYKNDEAYEKVIDQLQDPQGKPSYDTIGLQFHMHTGALSSGVLWKTVDRFAHFKVPINVTEMTILSGAREWEHAVNKPWPSTPEGEAYQAQEIVRVYRLFFSHPSVQAISWWDFSDLKSWRNAPSGLVRKDMTPKPAYEALKHLIKEKWWTRSLQLTPASGAIHFRGFFGDYKIEIKLPDGRRVIAEKTLGSGKNLWIVQVPD